MNGTEGKGREGEKRRDGLIVTGEEWRRREGGIEIEGRIENGVSLPRGRCRSSSLEA